MCFPFLCRSVGLGWLVVILRERRRHSTYVYDVAFRGLKPGQEVLDAVGGAHKFQSWPHNILTGAWIYSPDGVLAAAARTKRADSDVDDEDSGG